jgi:hypothetical protein
MNDAGRGRRRVRVQGAALAILLAASALETVAVTSGLAAARDGLLVMIAATMVAAAVWG